MKCMSEEEAKQTLEQIKEEFKRLYPNKDDEEIEEMILDMLFRAFCEDVITREDLCGLTELLGYEPDEDVLDQVENEKRKE